jgi:hypothetical protein
MKVDNLKPPSHIVDNCCVFWQLFPFLFFSRKQGISHKTFFFQNTFCEMAKISHQKIHWFQVKTNFISSLSLEHPH